MRDGAAMIARLNRHRRIVRIGIAFVCMAAPACYQRGIPTEATVKPGQRCAGEEVAEVSNRTTDPVDILFSDGKVTTMLQAGIGLGTTSIPLPRPGYVYAQFNGQIVNQGISVRLICRAR
jgi:hypothetical protein